MMSNFTFGFFETEYPQYLTFPSMLFIVSIIVAVASVLCFALAPLYSKGKNKGAKTACSIISVFNLVIGILLFVMFVISAMILLASNSLLHDDDLVFFALGYMLAPVKFGMPFDVSTYSTGLSIGFYALYMIPAGILGIVSFGVSCSASTKFKVANGLIPNKTMPQNMPYPQYAQQSYPQYQQNTQQGYPQYQQNTQQGYPQYQQNTQQGYPQYQQNAQQSYPQYQQSTQQGYPQYQQNAQQGYSQYQQNTQQSYPQQASAVATAVAATASAISPESSGKPAEQSVCVKESVVETSQPAPVTEPATESTAQTAPVAETVPEPVAETTQTAQAEEPVSEPTVSTAEQVATVTEPVPEPVAETTQTASVEDTAPSGEDFSKLLDDESDPVNTENTAAQTVAPVTDEAAQQTAPALFCVNCGKPVMPGMAFCSNCGYRVNGVQTDVCTGCGAKLADGAVFCTNCGKRVD